MDKRARMIMLPTNEYNTVTIRRINSKEEHILKFVNDFINEFPEENLEYLRLRAETWIEDNL